MPQEMDSQLEGECVAGLGNEGTPELPMRLEESDQMPKHFFYLN